METSVLYGVKADTFSSARDLINSILDIQMEQRESLHFGGDYYNYVDWKDSFLMLRRNIDIVELDCDGASIAECSLDELMQRGACLAEPEHPEYPFLLYLEEAEEHRDIWKKLDENKEYFDILRIDSE